MRAACTNSRPTVAESLPDKGRAIESSALACQRFLPAGTRLGGEVTGHCVYPEILASTARVAAHSADTSACIVKVDALAVTKAALSTLSAGSGMACFRAPPSGTSFRGSGCDGLPEDAAKEVVSPGGYLRIRGLMRFGVDSAKARG